MYGFARNLLVAGTMASLVLLQVPASRAHPAAAFHLNTVYMTTSQAYDAYSPSHAFAPPKVTAYPKDTESIGFYFEFTGAVPKKDTFHVDFVGSGRTWRHGSIHSFDNAASSIVLELPATALSATGRYQAQFYRGTTLVSSVPFSVITVPSVDAGYMISGASFDSFGGDKNTPAPKKVSTFTAPVSRVAAYFDYTGGTKSDVHYVAVFNNYGKLVHRSENHTWDAAHLPGGSFAIVLPPDAGSYPKGAYRTDLYIDNALVMSVPWTAK